MVIEYNNSLQPTAHAAAELHRYILIMAKNTKLPRSTESIPQAKSLDMVQNSVLCRASMVNKLFGPVSEEAFKCSAASKTTLRPNSFRLNTLCLIASAEQWYSCPHANADGVNANEGPAGFLLVGVHKNAA